MKYRCRVALPLLALAVLTQGASAGDWTIVILHPPSADASNAEGVDLATNQQVGEVKLTVDPAHDHAALWSGAVGSFVDLQPAGAIESAACEASAGQQAGTVFLPAVNPHAALWTGTAASFVDLHPDGAISSIATGTSNGTQSGYAFFKDAAHACIWNGTAASFTDLHPGGDVTQSLAWDIERSESGGGEGPSIEVGGFALYGVWPDIVLHAARWSGTAATFVDLHPAGAGESEAFGVSDCQQAGYATFDGVGHAALWSGAAASFVDLHPPAVQSSVANAVSCGYQAGLVSIDGYIHAALWSGTAESFVNLQTVLASQFPQFDQSWAQDIDVDEAGNIAVAGFAFNTDTQRLEALMWLNPAGIPGDVDGDGDVDIDDLFAVIAAWGPCPNCDLIVCEADLDRDCDVDIDDLFMVIGNWS